MQRTTLLFSLVLLSLAGRTQSLNCTWAWSAGDVGSEYAVVDVGHGGDVYLLGNYEDTVDANGTTVISSGQRDVFVQQLDPSDGSVIWTAEAHNTADLELFDIAYRSTGEIVVSGAVYHDGNETWFGPFSIPGQDFGYQAFVAGLSPSGSWTWLGLGPDPTTLSTRGTLVEVDANNDILLQCGYQSVVVCKFTGAGVPVWTTTASSSDGSLDGYAMDVTPDNGLVITGRFHDTGTFGTIDLVDNTNYYDAFIARLSASGVWEWAVQAGGSHWDKGFGVSATTTGDVLVMGTYRNTATFGPFQATAPPPNSDLWFARLSAAGDWLSLNDAGSTAYMEIYAMDLSEDGSRVLCTGSYAFGTPTLDGLTLPTPSSNDVYIAELDTSGVFLAVKGFGASEGDQGLGAAYDPDGNIYASGNFSGDMTLDAIDLDQVYSNDLWVGRFGPDLGTALPALQGPEASISLSIVEDRILVTNPGARMGEIHLHDALGRTLGSWRLTGDPLQRLALSSATHGVILWRALIGSNAETGKLVR